MVLLANLLIGIAQVLGILIDAVMTLLVVRAVLSWIQIPTAAAIAHFCAQATEPLIAPFRRWIRPTGGFDWAFLALFACLYLIKAVLVVSLFDYAQMLKMG